jgi:multidrug efflux pump subunit AcrA (membrane-fusion protein)/rubrerythrin
MRPIVKYLAIPLIAILSACAGYFYASSHPHPSAASGASAASATAGATAENETLYTCGMHPQILQKKPGDCPICGMKLTPVRHQSGEANPTEGAQTITIAPEIIQNMGLRTGLVTHGPLRRVIRSAGAVDFDETTLADVTTKFKGWIEKLFVNATGQQVHKGDPLFEIYSPELYAAQSEFILSLDASEALKSAALNKLRFYDISEEQIEELKKSRAPRKTLRVTAPCDGIVVEKAAVEGQMVDAGMRLYRLADLALVWVQAQIYEQDIPFVSLGQEAVVSLASMPDRKFRGRVTYIYPTVDEKTRAGRVRMEFHNPGYLLKPGMYATVSLTAELDPRALLIPDSAVLRSGENNTVFVALGNGRFEPRTIALGLRAEGGYYQVLSGLKEGERVVTSGEFMLDSESQLRDAIQKMSHPGGHPQTGVNPTSTNAVTSDGDAPATAAYLCPMPEHVSIRYDHPGKCPLCSMTLIPVSAEMLSKIQPGAALDHYTCPMPEHANVHLDKPGKCPHCGMTLIPVMKTGASASQTNAPSTTAAPATTLYTCPMEEDADIVSDKPDKCPKCGMKLVPTSTVPHGARAELHWKEKHP